MRIRTAIPAAVAAAALTALAALPAQAATAATNSPTARLTSSTHGTGLGPGHLFAKPQAAPRHHGLVTADDATAAPQFTTVTADRTASGLVLKAVLDAADPASGVTADFYVGANPATDKDGTTPLPTYNLTWNDTDGAWELPLDLPVYNTYNVVLHATNQVGTTPYDLNDVAFVLQPQLDPATTIGPATVDYAHQSVTATGKVTLWDPRTGQSQAPGTTYTVVYLNGPAGSGLGTWGTVAADGSFSLSVGVPGTFAGGLFQAYAQTGNASSDSVSQAVNTRGQSATRIVLDHTAVSGGTAGRSYTVGGVVQYQAADGSWAPLTGVHLDYQSPGDPGWYSDWNAITDGNGRFSVSTTVPAAPGTFSVRPSSIWTWSPYLTSAAAVHVAFSSIHQVVTLHLDAASIDEYSDLSAYQTVSSTNNRVPGNKVYLLASPNGKTGWKNLGYIPVTSNVWEQNISGWVPNPHGWYRLYTPAATGYSATYGNIVHVFRYETIVTGGKPAHTTIAKNHYLTIGGHVYYRGYGSWQVLKGTHVYLFFRPTGSKQWQYVSTARTDSHGFFRVSGKATRSGTWEVAWFTPNQWYVDSWGPNTWVRAS